MRRVESGCCLGLALESLEHHFGFDLTAGAEQLGPHELDGRSSGKQAMFRFPHFAHSSVPEQVDQLVAAQLARFAQLVSDVTKKSRWNGGQGGGRIVGPEDQQRSEAATASARREDAPARHRWDRTTPPQAPPPESLRGLTAAHHRINEQQDRNPRDLDDLRLHGRRRHPCIQRGDRLRR